MPSVSSIALSGLGAAASSLGSAAHNIANLGTSGFRRELTSQTALADGGVTTHRDRSPQPGVDLEREVVGLLSAKNAFLANLAVFRTSDAMMGTLLDLQA